MTPQTVLLVSLGAVVGAPLRFVVERRLASAYPWGTWLVNVAGSAVLGVLVGYTSPSGSSSTTSLLALVGAGFCGSLTTFGGFAAQVLDLAVTPVGTSRGSRSWRSLGYGAISVVACVSVAALGYAIGASFGD